MYASTPACFVPTAFNDRVHDTSKYLYLRASLRYILTFWGGGGGGGEGEPFQEYDVREWCDREGNAGSRVDLMTFQTID